MRSGAQGIYTLDSTSQGTDPADALRGQRLPWSGAELRQRCRVGQSQLSLCYDTVHIRIMFEVMSANLASRGG